MLSVIVPTLDAGRYLEPTLAAITGPPAAETIVVDGGSSDDTAEIARRCGARVIPAPRGRGAQLAAGVEAARESWVLMLHADTVLDAAWRDAVLRHMHTDTGKAAYFRFVLASESRRARHLERLVAWRCRALALPYGDQGLLLHRDLLTRIGGVRPLPIMEDVDLVRRLGRRRLVLLDVPAVTSAEKWERDGWTSRSLRNLFCLSLYFAGLPPRAIVRLYR